MQTASKREIQKTTEATGDLIGNKIADKITSVLRKSATKLHPKELNNDNETEEDVEMTTHKKRYVSSEERQQTIDGLRLVPKNY